MKTTILILCSLLISFKVQAQNDRPIGKFILTYLEADPAFNDLTPVHSSQSHDYVKRIQSLYIRIKLHHRTIPASKIVKVYSSYATGPYNTLIWLQKNGYQYSFYIDTDNEFQETNLMLNETVNGTQTGDGAIFEFDHITQKGYLSFFGAFPGKNGKEVRIKVPVDKMFSEFERMLTNFEELVTKLPK